MIMKTETIYLAFDLGATSIRGILARIGDQGITLEEVLRYKHEAKIIDGLLCWDFAGLYREIHNCIDSIPHIDAIGIDSWGVDYGLVSIDPSMENKLPIDRLLDSPVCYREPSHERGLEELLQKFSQETLFSRSGNQVLSINTLAQLASRKERTFNLCSDNNARLLPMPDLMAFCLTGELGAEESMLSTTMFYDQEKHELINEFLEAISFDPKWVARKRQAGTYLGRTHKSLFAGRAIPVITVLGHDTAGAFVLSEAFTDLECAFLSCGTWSLLGAGLEAPICSREAAGLNLSNELAAFGRAYAVKNLTGLYWIERLRHSLGDKASSFDELGKSLLGKNAPFLIDTEDSNLLSRTDLYEALCERASEEGLSISPDEAHLVLYDSLVARYVTELAALTKLTGRNYKKIHVVGGGSKSALLMQKIADATGVEVLAGPAETSSLGNLTLQMYAHEKYGEDFEKGITCDLDGVEGDFDCLKKCRERFLALEDSVIYKAKTN